MAIVCFQAWKVPLVKASLAEVFMHLVEHVRQIFFTPIAH